MTEPYYCDDTLTLLLGDAVEQMRALPDASVDCVVTSPPYYALRDYGHTRQIGLEDTPQEFVANLLAVFAEVRRVLADDGTFWLNIGDSYGSATEARTRRSTNPKPRASGRRDHALIAAPRDANPFRRKSLTLIPERVTLGLVDQGWILRNKIVWRKTNPMPDPTKDRLTCHHEPIYLFVKSEDYWFDLDAIRVKPKTVGKTWAERKAAGAPSRHGVASEEAVPSLAAHEAGANPGDVWDIPTRPLRDEHYAPFPLDLPHRCILAGCKPSGVVLDPFSGAGTTALAAQQLGHRAIGIDLVSEYHDIALRRMSDAPLPFAATPGGTT